MSQCKNVRYPQAVAPKFARLRSRRKADVEVRLTLTSGGAVEDSHAQDSLACPRINKA